jgi:large subunit ribosomal protein L14e
MEKNKMTILDIGSICVKKLGRETGRKCIVVDIIDKSFVLVTGPQALSGVKRRRANVNHLEPIAAKLNITRQASDEDVIRAVEAEGKTEEMKAKL